MAWNWELAEWPHFEWDRTRLHPQEARFLMTGGIHSGTIKHLLSPEREHLLLEAMSTEALTTSEIEGEMLDRASVPVLTSQGTGIVSRAAQGQAC